MNLNALQLKVVLPSHCALQRTNVRVLTVPTPTGLLRVLPDMANFIAAVGPGTASWHELRENEEKVLLERGVLIKAGSNVLIMTQSGLGDELQQEVVATEGRNSSDAFLSKMKDGHIESVISLDRR